MTTLSEIEIRRERDDAIRGLLEFLTYRTQDPAHIGARAIVYDYALHKSSEENQISQRELAERLGIGESALSERLAAVEKTLSDLRHPKFPSGPENL